MLGQAVVIERHRGAIGHAEHESAPGVDERTGVRVHQAGVAARHHVAEPVSEMIDDAGPGVHRRQRRTACQPLRVGIAPVGVVQALGREDRRHALVEHLLGPRRTVERNRLAAVPVGRDQHFGEERGAILIVGEER